MNALKWAVIGVAAAAIAGCAGTGLQKTQMMKPKGSSFDKGLYAGYVGLAKGEYREGDYNDSDTFAMRASASATGKGPAPEKVAMRHLPKKNVGELTKARGRLTSALAAGAAEKAPKHASHAQVMFDCWMQEQEENFQPFDIAKCRTDFFAAMAQTEAALKPKMMAKKAVAKPAAMKRRFIVYFPFDSADITPTSRNRIMQAIDAAKKIGAKRVYVSGFTDTSGSNTYNMSLSEQRANAVAGGLKGGGLSARVISTGAFGQGILAVKTKDGVKMPDNRRVTIQISN